MLILTYDNPFLFVKSQGFNVQLIFHLFTMYKQQFDIKVYEQGFQLHDKLSRVLSPKLAQSYLFIKEYKPYDMCLQFDENTPIFYG